MRLNTRPLVPAFRVAALVVAAVAAGCGEPRKTLDAGGGADGADRPPLGDTGGGADVAPADARDTGAGVDATTPDAPRDATAMPDVPAVADGRDAPAVPDGRDAPATPDAPPAPDSGNGAPNGTPCSNAAACASRSCVDGFCCDGSCAGQCEACDVAGSEGTCSAVPSGPPHSVRSPCGGTGPCAGACGGGMRTTCLFPGTTTPCGSASCTGGTLTPVGGCNAAGSCAQAPMACATGYCSTGTTCGACPNDPACGAGRWCDTAAGVCRAKVANGQPCGGDNQCANGNCETNAAGTGGICCASACAGTTPRCNDAGSACICAGTSCGGGSVVCFQGSCCTPVNCATGCREFACQPGCGLAVVPANCGAGNSGCCDGSCCNANCCGPPQGCTNDICF